MLAVSIVTTTLATFVVILRLWGRRLMRISSGLDDHLAFASLMIYYGQLIVAFLYVLYGGTGTDQVLVFIKALPPSLAV